MRKGLICSFDRKMLAKAFAIYHDLHLPFTTAMPSVLSHGGVCRRSFRHCVPERHFGRMLCLSLLSLCGLLSSPKILDGFPKCIGNWGRLSNAKKWYRNGIFCLQLWRKCFRGKNCCKICSPSSLLFYMNIRIVIIWIHFIVGNEWAINCAYVMLIGLLFITCVKKS